MADLGSPRARKLGPMRARSLLLVSAALAGLGCTRRDPTPPAARAPARDAGSMHDAHDASSVVEATGAPRALRSAPPVILGVLPWTLKPLAAFPAGSRVLVSAGPSFVGWATAGAPMTVDASYNGGLSKEPIDAPLLVAGAFPKLALVHGHDTGSGSEVGGYFAYVLRGKTWVRARPKPLDRPWGLVTRGEGIDLFAPPPFYTVNGMNPRNEYGCEGKARRRFFQMGSMNDGGGRALRWGFDACEPGVHVLADGSAKREIVPGTNACAERSPDNGLPRARAAFFPAADGGMYAVARAEVTGPVEGRESERPCMAAPVRVYRSPKGAWSTSTALPLPFDGDVAVDPARTAFLAKDTTLLRVDSAGAVSALGLAPSCLALPAARDGGADDDLAEEPPPADEPPRIASVVAPFPDDVWIVLDRGRNHHALCRAVLRAGR